MGLSKLQWTFRFFRILVFLDFQDNGCLLQDLDFKGFSDNWFHWIFRIWMIGFGFYGFRDDRFCF